MQFINELREGDVLASVYYVKEKKACTTKAGKEYYDVTLQDKTGTINAKVWDIQTVSKFETGDYVVVNGQVNSYMNNLQVSIQQATPAKESMYDIANYMPVSSRNMDEMESELNSLIDSVKDVGLHKVLTSLFTEDFIRQFKSKSAAKSMHHAYIGGLLEHSVTVASLCNNFSSEYPLVNRDLVITAALCHDIGKVYELSDFPANDYTDCGQLLGHIFIGANMIDKLDIPELDHNIKMELIHCVLSHHGKLEYGSPKTPMTIEAVMLNFADDMDAKMRAFSSAAENAKEDWLGYHKMFDSQLRRPCIYNMANEQHTTTENGQYSLFD